MNRNSSSRPMKTRREPDAKRLPWYSPSGAPVSRRRLCGVCQPTLKRQLHTPQFVFHEATVLLIVAGQLDITTASHHLSLENPDELVLIAPNTRADLVKTPVDIDRPFRSIPDAVGRIAGYLSPKPASFGPHSLYRLRV